MTTIWTPKKELAVVIAARPRVAGWFKLEAIRPDGRVRPLTGWFPNLITDVGLNRMGQGNYLVACQVGTNNTPPNVNDTALAGYVAGTTTTQASSDGAQSTAPYYGWKRITYRFAEGTATGNIAEVAIASAAAFASAVNFSRALVLDEFGDPTTVTVLSDEVLDVTYELRLYPPLVDVTGTLTVTGSGTHDYTLRASNVTSVTAWGMSLGNVVTLNPYGSTHLSVYNGDIGAITSAPAGSSGSVGVGTAAYSNTSYLRQGTGYFGLNVGNLVGGIRSIRFISSVGAYQYRVDPIIDKTSTKTLAITNQVSWARYTP